MRRSLQYVTAVLAVVVVVLTAGTGSAGSVDLAVTTGFAGHGPADQETAGFDGVVTVDVVNPTFGERGTGALLWTGRHILTAAHLFEPNSISATVFIGGSNVAASSWTVHPNWDGMSAHGYDIAIIELPAVVPGVTTYDIYRQSNEVSMVGDRVGYGWSGVGNTGEDPGTYPYGTKRWGQNKWDALGDFFKTFDPVGTGFTFPDGSVLQYDFDNGVTDALGFGLNDGFGFWAFLPDLGVGGDEVMSASGDSGGPNFLNGKIAGITSFGFTFAGIDLNNNFVTTDIDWNLGVPNTTFGEFGSDTRVSFYSSWIDSVLAIPEPGTVALMGLGLAWIGLRLRRRSRQAS